jgi:protein O-GlcNAc transferase
LAVNRNDNYERGLSALQAGNLNEAERLLQAVIRAEPKHVAAFNLLGVVFGRLGRNVEALTSYDRALALAPNSIESWYGRGMTLLAIGRLEEAIGSFDRVIVAKPDFTQVHLLRAKLLADLGRHAVALEGMDNLLAIMPGFAEAWLGRSNILFECKRYQEALAGVERALALKPSLSEAWLSRGNVLNELKRYDDALTAFDQALALNPHLAGVWLGCGNVLNELTRYDDALAAYDKELAAWPSLAEAWLGRGNVLNALKRYEQAFAAFDRALALVPGLAEAWLGRGNAHFELKRYHNALAAYDRALALKSDLAGAWAARGNVLHRLKRHAEAAIAYGHALRLDPNYPLAKGMLLHQKMTTCNWGGIDDLARDIEKDIALGKLSAEPFGWQAVSNSPRSLQLCAELFNADKFPLDVKTSPARPPQHRKIRIGYLGDVFREQAVAYLLVGVLELHDKSHFEIYTFDNGWNDRSETRRRIDASAKEMIDITSHGDTSAAAVIREREIDVLVNLNVYFGDHRTGIFAKRPSPVQVNYLGFPATLGASYSDYIIADQCVIPPGDRDFYTEKVVYLPNCYQANDRKRIISARDFSRAECGLPQIGFVFCCFNNNHKITPDVFDRWMRILKKVGGSVLWLVEDNTYVAANLRKEAKARHVDPDRLIFAKRMHLPDHLARHRLADLFLDSLPYNAHTTASDALWAGLPVLTQIGVTFPGRVAASLLNAIGLPELITTTPQAYEDLAVQLATSPERLAATKRKLAHNRLTTSLFDTKAYTRHLEAAYTRMYERYQAGLGPDHMSVSDVADSA